MRICGYILLAFAVMAAAQATVAAFAVGVTLLFLWGIIARPETTVPLLLSPSSGGARQMATGHDRCGSADFRGALDWSAGKTPPDRGRTAGRLASAAGRPRRQGVNGRTKRWGIAQG